jgi:guanidinopropionase
MAAVHLPADARIHPRFSGIATLLRAAYKNEPKGLDVALVGIPSEFTVYRNGTRWGPSQVREQSRVIRPLNSETLLNPFELCSVADVGDVPVNPFSLEATNRSIEEYFTSLRSIGVRALAVGGDHGVTLPILRALAPDRPIGLLHFDAHHDTHDELYGTRDNHATLIRRAIEEDIVDPSRTVSVGLRGSLYHRDELTWGADQGISVITPAILETEGIRATASEIDRILAEGPIYLTIDIDVLDPSEAPGSGVPEEGGLSFRQVRDLLRAVRGREILGADLVEVSPLLDPSGRTAMLAANLLFEQLCLLADVRHGDTP